MHRYTVTVWVWRWLRAYILKITFWGTERYNTAF